MIATWLLEVTAESFANYSLISKTYYTLILIISQHNF